MPSQHPIVLPSKPSSYAGQYVSMISTNGMTKEHSCGEKKRDFAIFLGKKPSWFSLNHVLHKKRKCYLMVLALSNKPIRNVHPQHSSRG